MYIDNDIKILINIAALNRFEITIEKTIVAVGRITHSKYLNLRTHYLSVYVKLIY